MPLAKRTAVKIQSNTSFFLTSHFAVKYQFFIWNSCIKPVLQQNLQTPCKRHANGPKYLNELDQFYDITDNWGKNWANLHTSLWCHRKLEKDWKKTVIIKTTSFMMSQKTGKKTGTMNGQFSDITDNWK